MRIVVCLVVLTVVLALSVVAVATAAAAPLPAPPPQGTILGVHTVQQGETLDCIGRAYQVDPNAIAQVNNTSSPVPGQTLNIPAVPWYNIPAGTTCTAQFTTPVGWPPPPVTPTPPPYAPTPPPYVPTPPPYVPTPPPSYPPLVVPPVYGVQTVSAPALLGVHIVAPGETLYCIGRAYQVDPVAIAQANGGLSGYAVIVPGQALMIPATRWGTIPPGPVCHPQFNANWDRNSTSAPAAPVCGTVQFSSPTVPPQLTRGFQTNPPIQSLGTFTNGYGETFVMTVTGRRPDAVMAFNAGVPVCLGASRSQSYAIVTSRSGGLAAPTAQSSATTLRVTDVLSDPNTLNLVIQIDLTGAAVDRYGPQTALAFVIDPSIQPNALHYFWSQFRSYAQTYLSANAGGVTGTLLKNCEVSGDPLSVWAGQFNLLPLFATGDAYYALTVKGQNIYGDSSYNIAGTWGDLDVPELTSACP